MSVIKVDLIDWEGSEGTESIEYRLQYLVTTDDRLDGPFIVRSGVFSELGVLLGSTYSSGNESDALARITDISEKRISSGNFQNWLVDLTYAYSEGEALTPLNEPIKESVSWESVQRITDRWADGDYIVNTAGDPIVNGLEYEDNTPTVTYTLNQSVFPYALAQAVRNAINSTSWKGFAPYTVKIASMQEERLTDKRIGVYYAVSYTFAINPQTWKTFLASRGFNQLEETFPGSGVIVRNPIIIGGARATDQMPLDSAGQWSNVPFVIEDYLYPQVNFNTLFPFL